MELTKDMLTEIARIFQRVEYGRISFFLSPEKKTLDYTVETTHKLSLVKQRENNKDRRSG